ncbi:MAG: hypothetical protein RIT45_4177 [Pseudomonadota bacterium]|jgi:hypothetical protein
MVKDGTLTGADLKSGSVTATSIANETLTGGQIKNASLTAAEIAGETLTGAQVKNGSLTGADLANETLTGTQIKNGSVGYVDVNTTQIQRRVTGTCPAGFAITAIAENGTVTCESSDYSGKVTASVANGNWYRIGSLPAGDSAAGVFTLVDKSYRSQVRVRVAYSRGFEGSANVELLSHPRESTLVFEKLRVVENGTTTPMFVDVKVKANASVDGYLSPEPNLESWKLEALTLQGTSDSVSGYASRIFDLDYNKIVGDYTARLSVDRGGNTRFGGTVAGNGGGGALRVQTATGYVDVGSQNNDWMHMSTDRSKFYFNKRIHVDEGIVSSYDEDLYLQTSGTTRMRISTSNGNVGIGANPSTSYRLNIGGSTYMSGGLTTAGASRMDGGIGIGTNSSSTYKLNVSGNVRASNYYIGTTTLESYIVDVVNKRCRLWLGQGDNNASAYSRYAYTQGDGTRGGSTEWGTYSTLWSWVGLTGGVDDNDRLFIRFNCSTSY